MTKNSSLETGANPLAKNEFLSFMHLVFPRKKIKKNMRTTIIVVEFDEESKSEVRIGLLCKEKPENAEKCRKIIKLLSEKNDVKKYLVHQ